MNNLIRLPERNMEPPTPDRARCEKCGDAGETWLIGSDVLCTPEALLKIAEMALQGFAGFDFVTLVMMRDVLDASREAAEAQLLRVTGGKWSGGQR